MSQNNSHMHTEPARTVFHQSHSGSWFTIGFHSKRGKMFLLLRTISPISDCSVVNCSLACESRSPRKKINKRVKYRESLGEPLNLTGPKKKKKEWTKRQVFPASWSSEAELIFPHWGFRLGLYNNLWDNANRLLLIFLWEQNSLEEKMTWLKINVWWSVYHLDCNMFSMEIYVGCIHLNSRLNYWLRNPCDMDIMDCIRTGTEQNDQIHTVC